MAEKLMARDSQDDYQQYHFWRMVRCIIKDGKLNPRTLKRIIGMLTNLYFKKKSSV